MNRTRVSELFGERLIWSKIMERPGLWARFLRWIKNDGGWSWGWIGELDLPPEHPNCRCELIPIDIESRDGDQPVTITGRLPQDDRPFDIHRITGAGDRLREAMQQNAAFIDIDLSGIEERMIARLGRSPQDFVAGIVASRATGVHFISRDSRRDEWPEMHDSTWRERVKIRMPIHLFTKWSFHYGPGEEWHFVAIPKAIPHG